MVVSKDILCVCVNYAMCNENRFCCVSVTV